MRWARSIASVPPPGREVQDAAHPDRVWDGLAGGRLHRARRRDGPGRGSLEPTSWPACSSPQARAAGAESATPARSSAWSSLPAHPLHRGARDLRKAARVPFGEDFGGEDETLISQAFERPVMITQYPAAVKAFYMKRDPQDDARALGVDVIAPERPARSSAAASGARLPPEAHRAPACPPGLRVVPHLRRYGSVPHGGSPRSRAHVRWNLRAAKTSARHPFPRMLERLTP